MPVLLNRQRTLVSATLSRESISWRTAGEMVEVAIEVLNDSDDFTAADRLIIEAAPFGAFVPNVPIAHVAVGSLDPGERRKVSARFPRAFLDRLAGVPSGLGGFLDAIHALMDPKNHVHWIGNLNVYLESDPKGAVERHCAFGLKVPAGSRLAAMFQIIDGLDCTFETVSSSERWTAEILCPGPTALLAVQTPDEAGEQAQITVEVKRVRDRHVVPVEFEFETVDGWGESVGCVQV